MSKKYVWDRSRLVYLYEHNQFTVSEVSRFIEKTIAKAQEVTAEEMRKMYGLPECKNLSHSKKELHSINEPCPVEHKINNAFKIT